MIELTSKIIVQILLVFILSFNAYSQSDRTGNQSDLVSKAIKARSGLLESRARINKTKMDIYNEIERIKLEVKDQAEVKRLVDKKVIQIKALNNTLKIVIRGILKTNERIKELNKSITVASSDLARNNSIINPRTIDSNKDRSVYIDKQSKGISNYVTSNINSSIGRVVDSISHNTKKFSGRASEFWANVKNRAKNFKPIRVKGKKISSDNSSEHELPQSVKKSKLAFITPLISKGKDAAKNFNEKITNVFRPNKSKKFNKKEFSKELKKINNNFRLLVNSHNEIIIEKDQRIEKAKETLKKYKKTGFPGYKVVLRMEKDKIIELKNNESIVGEKVANDQITLLLAKEMMNLSNLNTINISKEKLERLKMDIKDKRAELVLNMSKLHEQYKISKDISDKVALMSGIQRAKIYDKYIDLIDDKIEFNKRPQSVFDGKKKNAKNENGRCIPVNLSDENTEYNMLFSTVIKILNNSK